MSRQVFIWLGGLIVIMLMYSACSNDVEKVNKLTSTATYPAIRINNLEVLRTDSGEVIVKVTGPEFLRYESKDPYVEFPKGVELLMYDVYPHVQNSIRANYARNNENLKLWEARGKVVAVNHKGEQLNTEQLFWDESKKVIYSNKFSRVSTTDGVFYGQRFIADQNFTWWKFLKASGSLNVQDE